MKVTTLIENNSGVRDDLYIEHGLSIFIEVDGKNILFDTGQSGDFIENAEKLGADLRKLDYVVISHGHYDHSGGLKRLIEEINQDFKLFLGRGFFREKYSLKNDGEYEYTGNPFDEDLLKHHNIEVEYIDEDIVELTENLSIFTNFNRDREFENINDTMYFKDNEKYKKDMFLDEISLALKTDKGLLIMVGCSHVGIVNILGTIKHRTGMDVYGVIGGTHLVTEDQEQINKIIDRLKEDEISLIGANHCTGKQGETMIRQQIEEAYMTNNTGDVLEFNEIKK